MSIMTTSSPWAYFHQRQILELKMLAFYHEILKRELPAKLRKKALNAKIILQNLKAASKETSGTSPDFHRPEWRCSSIFQQAAYLASVVAHHFNNMLHLNPWLLEMVLFADVIRICTLGGGPATEFVAVLKVLEELLWRYCPRGHRPLWVEAIVVDKNSGWSETARKVEEELQFHLVDTSVIKYRLSFLQADITKTPDRKLEDVLKRSDIVTMVRPTRAAISSILQAIVRLIPENGIFFYIDSSGTNRYETLKAFIGPIYQIYGLWELECYTMSDAFLAEHHRLYRTYSRGQYRSMKFRNNVSAWRKRSCWCTRRDASLWRSQQENDAICRVDVTTSATGAIAQDDKVSDRGKIRRRFSI